MNRADPLDWAIFALVLLFLVGVWSGLAAGLLRVLR